MKIAVTGAFSYSGKYITERLLERCEEVVTLTGHPNRLDPFNGKVKSFPLDFSGGQTLTASLQGSHVVLTWTPPPDDGGANIISYVIYRGPSLENRSRVGAVPGDTHSWIDVSVGRGKTYHYWVVAENSMGPSDMTRTASISVPNDPYSLVLPIALSAISGIFASGGFLLWRRRTSGKPSS